MVLGAGATVNTVIRNAQAQRNSQGRASRQSKEEPCPPKTWREKVIEAEREDNQQLLSSNQHFQEAQKTTAMQLLRACEFSALTVGDVQHLMKVLDWPQDYVKHEHLRILLTVVLDPPLTREEVQAVWALSEKRPDGSMSVEDIAESMKNGQIRYALADVRNIKTKRKTFKETAPLVDRELLKYWVAWRSNRDDAFRTLPLAVTYLLVFVLLVMCHLQIVERKYQERALETWVVGWSTKDWGGPYLHDHVTSVGSFHYWLKESGMPCLFSDSRKNFANHSFVHMASSSLMVGDARLMRVPQGNPGEEEAWLLNSFTAKEELKKHEGQADAYQLAAQARLEELHDGGFFDYEVEEIRLEWVTYNRRTRMFCLNAVKVVFKGSGFIMPSFSSIAVIIEPYPRHQIIRCSFIWSLCGLYCILIIIPLLDEGKEILLSLKIGFKGFKNYWGFWNAVDWITVAIGLSVIVVWVTCCQYMNENSIQTLINDDYFLDPWIMQLNGDQIQQLRDDLYMVAFLFYVLQIIMATNVITIVLKLFKAFKSNARLSVVTDTMKDAAVDIVHFGIVFMVIFVSFAMMAHVLFGNDLKEFESFGTSVVTSFLVLMGDFGWYCDFQNSPGGFGSGMPRAVMTVWYLAYQFFVLLCLMNMLLAVIMERYAKVSGALEGSAEAPTLWVQLGRYFERRKATKGFMPLVQISTALEVEGNNIVHPGNNVTSDSLVEAFPGMKPEQGKWLMKYLEKEAKARQPGDSFEDVNEKLGDVSSFVESMAEELHIVQITTLLASRRLDKVEEQVQSNGSKLESPSESLRAQIQEQARALDDLGALVHELVNAPQKLTRQPSNGMAPYASLHTQKSTEKPTVKTDLEERLPGSPCLPFSPPSPRKPLLLSSSSSAWLPLPPPSHRQVQSNGNKVELLSESLVAQMQELADLEREVQATAHEDLGELEQGLGEEVPFIPQYSGEYITDRKTRAIWI